MGYGAQHDIKFNGENYGSVVFDGRNFRLSKKVKFTSWDFTHPMDGMENIRLDLLKFKVYPIELDEEGREYLKKDGYKRGECFYFKWEEHPNGSVWSGYVRSSIEHSFPVDLKGEIYIEGYGSAEIVITVEPKNVKKFEKFIRDVLDFSANYESRLSFETQYARQERRNRVKYGANRLGA